MSEPAEEIEEQGICMNCGAEMDYSPMHPWCEECDRREEDEENQDGLPWEA